MNSNERAQCLLAISSVQVSAHSFTELGKLLSLTLDSMETALATLSASKQMTDHLQARDELQQLRELRARLHNIRWYKNGMGFGKIEAELNRIGRVLEEALR